MMGGPPAVAYDYEATLQVKASAKEGRVEGLKQSELLMASYTHLISSTSPADPGCLTPGAPFPVYAMNGHPWSYAMWWFWLPLNVFYMRR